LGWPHLAVLAILLATALAWFPSTKFSFVYDDREQILQNSRIRMPDYPKRAFSEDLWRFRTPDPDKPSPGGQYYRPVFALWLWANWQQFGENPRGWHVGSILLHLLVTWLVWRLAFRLARAPAPALAAALLFGLHPIHAESVAWAAGSTDLLLAVWTLGALLAFLRGVDARPLGRAWLALSVLLFALAALTKETAYVFPILFLAAAWWTPNGSEPSRSVRRAFRALLLSLPFFAVAGVVFAVRWKVIGFLSRPLSPSSLDLRQTLLTLPRVLLEYLSMLLVSAPAGLGHPIRPTNGFGAASFWLPLVIALGLLSALALLLRPWRHSSQGILAVAAILPMIPILDLRLLIPDALVQDRYLYLTSAFFVPAVALAVWRLLDRPGGPAPAAPFLAAAGALALLATFRLATLRDTFRDEITLFTRAAGDAPDNGIFQHRLGLALLEVGRLPEAIATLGRAVEIEPKDWVNEINLSLALGRAGKLEQSVEHQGRALAIAEELGELATEPRFAGILHQRSLGLEKLGRRGEAEEGWRRALALDPRFLPALEELARVAFERSDWPEAEARARALVDAAPDQPDSWGTLGSVLAAESRWKEAEEAFRKATSLAPERPEGEIGLTQVLARTGRLAEARATILRALEKAPGHPAAQQLARELGAGAPGTGAPPPRGPGW
jgi:tetratricopeptide (TPR) repeat protein